MSQYKSGSVSVINGSAVVTGVDTLWVDKVSPRDLFIVPTDGVVYEVAAVSSDTGLTLTAPWSGATMSGAPYIITGSFTPVAHIPYPDKGDLEIPAIFRRAMTRVETAIQQISLLGLYRGDWAAGISYAANDAVLDGVAGSDSHNIYLCKAAHTSAGFATDLAAGKWNLLFDLQGIAATAETNAATSAADAAASADSALTAKLDAESGSTAAAASAAEADASKTAAATSETNAAASAASASVSATDAIASKTAAAESESNAAASVIDAAASATAADASQTAAATSEANAAISADAADASKVAAATSATAASASQAAAATSEVNAATSADAAIEAYRDSIIRTNPQLLTADYLLDSGVNGSVVGPLSIAPDVQLVVRGRLVVQ